MPIKGQRLTTISGVIRWSEPAAQAPMLWCTLVYGYQRRINIYQGRYLRKIQAKEAQEVQMIHITAKTTSLEAYVLPETFLNSCYDLTQQYLLL